MESKKQSVEETPNQSIFFWVGAGNSREVTLFDLPPEEVERVAKLFGVEIRPVRRKIGKVWRENIRARGMKIGTLEINMHSRDTTVKDEEATI
jgi:hypothetical protein